MKKILTILLFSVLALTMSAQGNYSSLWKQYEKAQEKDQPKTALAAVKKIETKAEKEKHYGQLLAALFTEKELMEEISYDSLKVMEKRMKEKHEAISKTDPLAACLYEVATNKAKKGLVDSLLYHSDAATLNEITKPNGTLKYIPFVRKGEDSKYFNHDLISLIACSNNDFEPLVRYYSEKGNRKAACIAAALQLTPPVIRNGNYKTLYLQKADSLISIYGDLPECGALAVRKTHILISQGEKETGKALAWIDEALKRWPSWMEMNELRNQKEDMIAPSVNLSCSNSIISTSDEAEFRLSQIRNISNITIQATPIVGYSSQKLNAQDFDIELEYKKLKTYLQTDKAVSFSKQLEKHEIYEFFRDTVSLGKLPLGTYLVELKTDGESLSGNKAILNVSDLKVITLQQSKKQIRYIVVNTITGHPVSGAKLHIQKERGEEFDTFTVNENGEYTFNSEYDNISPRYVYATTEEDNAQYAQSIWTNYYNNPREKGTANKIEVFTDRSIYRPGQTVHASVLAYSLINEEKTKAKEGEKLVITLLDRKYNKISEVNVTTDDFGTASADFTLPEKVDNGIFHIYVKSNSRCRIRVEEYIRPTYEVKINKPEIDYKDGDTITVTGTARTYSGVAVSNAKVAYSVRRSASWWWRSTSYIDSELLKDSVQTDASGNFEMKVPMILPEAYSTRKASPYYWCPPAFYNINISADVTDMAGESHNATLSLPLSNRATSLSCDIEGKYLKGEKPIEIKFTRRNNAGTEIEGEVAVTIDDKEQEKAICGKSYVIPMYLPSGSHSLKAICGNDTIEKKFVLFSLEDKVPATETHNWWYVTGDEFPATIQLGTSDRNVHAFYTIFSEKGMIESGSVELDSSLVTRKFEYKEEYGDGICYTIAWVRNGKLYENNATIKRTLPDNTLKLNWTTFRNKLEPGQKEEWKLSVTDVNDKPAKANVMAVLYDMSLDGIYKHNWNFNITRSLWRVSFDWKTTRTKDMHMHLTKPYKFLDQKEPDFSSFAYGFSNYLSCHSLNGTVKRIATMLAESKALNDVTVAGYGVMRKTSFAQEGEVLMAKEVIASENSEETQVDVPLRTNLNETAFFMPQLRTDDNGIVTLAFTLPESVTTWKFMALAHDKDVKYGSMQDEVIAQKKLMIQPRLPRFLREGDVTDIPASVSNLTEKDINATVKFSILDAKTEKVLSTQSKKITVKANETETISFAYDTKNQEDKSIIVRYTVSGKNSEGSFSDGEQKDLPILSQKELMVNTQTFILAEAGEKKFDLNSIMPSVDEKHLTIEYTDSPEWLMIKALPQISNANDECAICLSSAYYANSIASGIARSNPEIKNAVKEWKSEELTQLFDSISLNYRNTDVLSRLSKLQNSDGSWSWWKGMNGSRYMTISILKTLLRLDYMLNDNKVKQQNAQLVNRAFRYLDKEIAEDVKEMKKEKYKYLPYYALDYLYCRAIAKASGTKISSNSNAEYLLKLVPEETRYDDMRTKAEAAIILYYGGKKSKAEEFIKSIKEHTVYRDDLGRYFDSKRAAYSWCDYKIPTQVSAIEALKLIDSNNSAKEIVEMKRWLLQSKRTQSWDTQINAIDAIYAFLCPSQGTTTSLRKGVPADIALGKTILEAQEYTSALGYVKTSRDITSKDKVLSFTKHTNGESWANVFIEYKQAATESSESSTGLSITRKVETNGKELKVGDKVEVTITITADRDYDFVTVTDNRPACLEPVEQLSGYSNGTYKIVRDTKTEYCYNMMRKGTHVIKTSYYVARTGNYTSGIATATCTYSPVFTGRTPGSNYVVK